MKRLLILASILLGLGTYHLATAQNIHCLVLDKTMSMTGHGGDDIWDDVQNYCYGWIDGLDQNSKVLFFTYDKDLYGPKEFNINSDADKEKVKEAVKNVVVDGKHTFIASNLKKVVEYAYEKYPDGKKKIYLITDGVEEQPGSDFVGVLNDFDGRCSEYDHLYYVDLNDKADPTIVDALNESAHATRGKGFVKFVTVEPDWEELSFVIGDSKQLEQRFIVPIGNYPSELAFSVKVDSIAVVGEGSAFPNVDILPSKIAFGKMTKIEEGKYKFNVNFINNSARECDLYIKLDGAPMQFGDDVYQVTAKPAGFWIKARNKTKPAVVVIGNGWE